MPSGLFQRQLAGYAAVHRSRRNKATHFVWPMFLVAESPVASGYRADLAVIMGEGDVTAR
jgi:uncharacterized membrane protein YGL010W